MMSVSVELRNFTYEPDRVGTLQEETTYAEDIGQAYV